MINKFKTLPLLAVAAMLIPTANVNAAGDPAIVRKAHNIEKLGAEIKNEFQTHYKRSSAYKHLRTDIDEFLRKAEVIDRLSHDPRTSFRQMNAELTNLDKLSSHIHEIVDDIEKGRYSGYVEDGLGHVHDKLRSLDFAIDDMQRALVVYSRPVDNGGCRYAANNNRGKTYSPAPVVVRPPIYTQPAPRRESEWERFIRTLFGNSRTSTASNSHGHKH